MAVHPTRGFTLLELLITLVISAILLGMAAPSFREAMADHRLRQDVETFRQAAFEARSESIVSGAHVTVCPHAGANACGSNWSGDLMVFVDGTISDVDAAAVRDADDRVVRIVRRDEATSSLKVYASYDGASNNTFVPSHLRYAPSGTSSWRNGSFVACDVRGKVHARVLNVLAIGDIRAARRAASGVALDAFAQEITCA